MAKHIWLSNLDTEKVRLCPYTDIVVNDASITLIRSDIRVATSICCSNRTVLNRLYQMLVNGYSPDESSPLLEDKTVSMWLEGCIKKGVIE